MGWFDYEIIDFRRAADVHGPDFTRVNATLQQFGVFYTTCNVKEGDGMYLAPVDRIKIR